MQIIFIKRGGRENFRQFPLLVLMSVFVEAMIGQERSILPIIAEHDFSLTTDSAILSYILIFGLSMAFKNLIAGFCCDQFGRKTILVAG